jgi:hypothetical protein
MKLLSGGLSVVRAHPRAYLVMHLFYFGLVGCGMLYAWQQPEMHAALRQHINEGIKGSLGPVVDAYGGRRLLMAIGLTFLVNLIGGSFASVTLPSLVVPFSGLAVGGLRAFVWGLIFSPGNYDVNAVMWGLTLLLLFLEGEAYILTMLAAYVQGKSFLRPSTAGVATHWEGYRAGVRQTAAIYPLVALELFAAAVYEATMLIVLRPLVI